MAIKGYWRLNGNSNDASGNGYNGTDTAITYSQANGRLGQGAGFNGSSSKITLPDSLAFSGAYSVCFMLKMNATGTYSIYDRGGINSGIIIKVGTSSQQFSVITTTPLAQYNILPTKTLTINKWYHIAAVFFNPGMKLYIDAVEVGSNNSTGTGIRGTTAVTVGVDYTTGSASLWLNGCLDELIVDNVGLTPAKVKNEYARVKGFF